MGMDLIPQTRVRQVESFHFNWNGWSQIGDLLDQLGENTNELSGSNDGDKISAKTCKRWARTLSAAMDRGLIKSIFKKSDIYMGGGYDKLVVTQGDTKLEKSVAQEDIKWLNRFIEFLNKCGGCRQY